MELEWVGDAWGWFTTSRVAALSAVAASVVGIRTFQRNRRDSKSRSRPMVGAELQSIPYVDGILLLVVKNYGQAVARNVRVDFDPPLPTDGPEDHSLPYLARRYDRTIATMMPGAEFSNVYWDGDEDHVPSQLTVTITSESADTNLFGRPDRYRDKFVLDVDVFMDGTSVESTATPHGQRKKLTRAVEAIAKVADTKFRPQ